MVLAAVMHCIRACVLSLAVLLAAGCAMGSLREAVPEKLANSVDVEGYDTIRVWGDHSGGAVQQILAQEAKRQEARKAAGGPARPLRQHILALSGGADDGAFGAGLLVGWTAHKSRPTFDVVNGISAGALIAPFAFLGPDYDHQLEAIFKLYGGEDIYRVTALAGLLGGTALADSQPLANLITKYVDARLVDRLAEERAKGRLVIIGTTNLDAQRPVFWDIGKIAASRRPDAPELIRKVLLASASIPGLFPPVQIKVTAGGKRYEELHVDGGPTREVFFAPNDFSFREFDKRNGRQVQRTLWVIRNAKLEPEYKPVDSGTLAISQRSIETLIKYQGLGDLIRIYHNAKTENIDYNMVSVPADFNAPRSQPFDREYMKALFAKGYELGRKGGSWVKSPPGVAAAATP